MPYFDMYNALPYIMNTHVFVPNFQEKNLSFSFSFFNPITYLYLETKLLIIFQDILHMYIIIAF